MSTASIEDVDMILLEQIHRQNTQSCLSLFGTGNLQNVAGQRGERGAVQRASSPGPIDWRPQERLRGCLCHSPAPRSRLCSKEWDAMLARLPTLLHV